NVYRHQVFTGSPDPFANEGLSQPGEQRHLRDFAATCLGEVRPGLIGQQVVRAVVAALETELPEVRSLEVKFFRRRSVTESRGLALAGVVWLAADQGYAELRDTLLHEFGHMVAPGAAGGSVEAERRADQFMRFWLVRLGWEDWRA